MSYEHFSLNKWLLKMKAKFGICNKPFLLLTHSTRSREKPGRFRQETIYVGEALVPHVNGNIDNVGHKTEGRERRMQEESIETPFVSVV